MIRTGGPNAGHTVLDERGQVYKLRQLPTAAISAPGATIAIAAGSLVDCDVLFQEVKDTGIWADGDQVVYIDPQATILEPRHIERERADAGLAGWSTQKGIGAARADRIRRTAAIARDWDFGVLPVEVAPVDQLVRSCWSGGVDILIEAAQGYGLGLHTDYYPKTTSADCRAIDALADCGISPWEFGVQPDVWLAVRPNPIRVAGVSGELKGETSWEQLGMEVERTTVTNKVRRVGAWDPELVRQAILANGGPADNVKVCLTMADKVIPAIKGLTDRSQLGDVDGPALEPLNWWRQEIWKLGARVCAIGTGPDTMMFYPSSI